MNMKHTHYFAMAALLVGAVCVGCDIQPPPPERRAVAGAISLSSTWRITSQGGGFKNLQSAIDGQTLTAAMTSEPYRGASITIDLGRKCLFNLIGILHGREEHGYARIVSVYTSLDGKSFEKRYTTAGTRAATYLPIFTPIRARYVRLVAEEAGPRPWTLSEIYLQ